MIGNRCFVERTMAFRQIRYFIGVAEKDGLSAASDGAASPNPARMKKSIQLTSGASIRSLVLVLHPASRNNATAESVARGQQWMLGWT